MSNKDFALFKILMHIESFALRLGRHDVYKRAKNIAYGLINKYNDNDR